MILESSLHKVSVYSRHNRASQFGTVPTSSLDIKLVNRRIPLYLFSSIGRGSYVNRYIYNLLYTRIVCWHLLTGYSPILRILSLSPLLFLYSLYLLEVILFPHLVDTL